MKKVFGSHSEVCHIWASRSQSEGSASRMFFDGDTIYSYGRHFPMARFISNDVVLITNQGYSISTAKHLSIVRRAVNHKRVYTCHDPSWTVAQNIKHESYEVNRIYELIAATKHERRIENLTIKLRGVIEHVESLVSLCAELEGGDGVVPDWAILPDNIIEAAKNAEAKREREIAEAEARLEAKNKAELTALKKKLKEWMVDITVALPPSAYRLPVALRVKGDEIETSHGAVVPIKSITHAMWSLIKLAREKHQKMLELDIPLGHFKATKIESDGTLIVGCHRIGYKELSKMASVLFGEEA